MVERQQVLDLEVGTPNFSNHYVLTWLSPTRVWREGVGGAEEDFLILLTTFRDTLLMCCLLVRSFHIWIQEHGRPTAVQAFGIGILKLLWAHILSSHTATCTCTCSSNLCSNPVASYKTLDHPSHLSSYSGDVLVLDICCLFLSLYRWLPLCPALPLPVDPHQPAAVPVAAALCWSGSQDTATWTPGEGTEPRVPLLLHLCAQHAGEVSLCHSPLLLLKMI